MHQLAQKLRGNLGGNTHRLLVLASLAKMRKRLGFERVLVRFAGHFWRLLELVGETDPFNFLPISVHKNTSVLLVTERTTH